ncbi:MAG: 4Fe-4S binding protein [Clostridia bacterium]|nr:4Fe-4S binding protein [Clostridia bacterium]
MSKPKIIYFRKLFQLFGLLFLAAIPVFDLFRLDLGNKQFLLLGQRFFVHQMYLVVIAFVLLTLLLVFFSRVVGRIWCGWFCPQNTWAELGDYFIDQGRKRNKSWREVLAFAGAVLSTFIMILMFAFVMVAFFIDPKQLWQQVAGGNPGAFVAILVVKLTVFGIANMLVVGHSFCWNICPYAMLQKVLANKDTLRIVFDPATCIDCGRCDKVCTMKLKPRYLDENKGVTDCINCGECIKACNIQANKNKTKASLLYAFGLEGKKIKNTAGLDIKAGLAGLVFLLLTIGLVGAFVTHHGVDISLGNELRDEAAVVDGWVENHYLLKLRTTSESTYPLEFGVTGLGGGAVITPERFVSSGQAEELIYLTVKVKAEELAAPLQPIKINVAGEVKQKEFTAEIKASFYNMSFYVNSKP